MPPPKCTRTMERHLKCADELWRLADAAIAAAGLGVRLPAMRWVNSPSLHLLADSDEGRDSCAAHY